MAISLRKGQKVNLIKNSSAGLGEILVNLNWNSTPVKRGLFSGVFGSSPATGIDLDLGCLYELKNGNKGTVQALGKAFGDLYLPPFISLDGDDRTGNSEGGENLRINGNHIVFIKRVLVFADIYDGVVNWRQADATATIKYPGAEDIIVKMDRYDTKNRICGLALFENVNDETFSVKKIVQFYPGRRALDEAFHWNLHWVYGKK